MQLRPYQQGAIYGDDKHDGILKAWETNDRILVVLPTGCGKTIVFCKTAEKVVFDGARVLILAHRGKLLDQAADKLLKSTGLKCSVEKAEQTSLGEWYRVTVGSIQTLMNEKRLCRFSKDYYDYIIVDEAHHALSDSFLRVLNYFNAKVLGVTATPGRGDKKELGSFFQTLAYEYSLPEAIRDGFLVPIKAQTIPIKIEIEKNNGEYSKEFCANALDPYLKSIAEDAGVRCKGRKTVIFTPLIATSLKLKPLLEAQGLRVIEVNGETKNQEEIFNNWDNGLYDVLLNSMLLTEGWDSEIVDTVMVLRFTKSRELYQQMVGRGTRIFDCNVNVLGLTSAERRALIKASKKPHLLLLDYLWLSEKNSLCRPAHLICESDEVAQVMTDNINDSACGPIDLTEAVEVAEQDTIAKREEALAKQLEELKHKKAKLVDPLQYEMSIQSEDLASYVPAFGWETEAPSKSQKDQLAKLDINPLAVESAGKAKKIIDAVSARQEAGLATPKQIRFLENKGFQHVGKWDKTQAKGLVDRIAANRWRVPFGIDAKSYIPQK